MQEHKRGQQSHKSPKLNVGSAWRGFLAMAASAVPPPLIIISLSLCISLSLPLHCRSHYSSSVMSSPHSIFSVPNNISMSSIRPSVSVSRWAHASRSWTTCSPVAKHASKYEKQTLPHSPLWFRATQIHITFWPCLRGNRPTSSGLMWSLANAARPRSVRFQLGVFLRSHLL